MHDRERTREFSVRESSNREKILVFRESKRDREREQEREFSHYRESIDSEEKTRQNIYRKYYYY